MVEGGRGVCWADQKETKDESVVACSEAVALSPLTESDVRHDVPPSSVLRRLPVPEPSAPLSSSLDATVVLHSVDLDSTFDVNVAPVEPAEPVFKVWLC